MTKTEIKEPRLEKVLKALVLEFKPEQVYLFGSQARGVNGPDSDYDLMLVLPPGVKKDRKAEDRAYRILFEIQAGIPVDILIWDYDSFHKRKHLVSSLPNTILDEGKLLYAG